MPTLQATSIADLVEATFETARKGEQAWNDLAAQYTECIALPRLFQKSKAKFDYGHTYQWTVLKSYGAAMQKVGLYATDNVDAADVLGTGSITWKHGLKSYGFDEHETVMNSGAEKIVDIIKARDAACTGAIAETLEEWFWGCPSSETDTLTMNGVGYWICWNSTSEDFSGTIPSTFTAGSTIGGLDPTTVGANQKGWRNYSATYTDVSKTDFVKKFRKAAYKMGWKSPIPSADPKTQQLSNYTTYNVLSQLETIAEQQNDNLGNDVASKDGKVKIRGFDVQAVPYLDTNRATSDPCFMIDWQVFHPCILQGWFLKRIPKPSGTQSAVMTINKHITANFVCESRRRCGVLAKSDPIAS